MQPFPGRGIFFLIRHGETDWNRERRIMGRLPVPLNATGREQARAAAAQLSGLGIEAIWTSPLARARSTAEIVAERIGITSVRDDAELTEMDFGSWEGRPYAEVIRDPLFPALQRDVSTALPGGESLPQVRERMFRAMTRIAAASDGARVAIVSHGDPLRLVIAGCLAIPIEEMRRLRLDTAGLAAIELTGTWAEVKFVNLRSDLAATFTPHGGARRTRGGRPRVADDEPIAG